MTFVCDITLILLCVSFFALTLGTRHTRPVQARRVVRARNINSDGPAGRQGAGNLHRWPSD